MIGTIDTNLDNNIEIKPCPCGNGTVTKTTLDTPREIPGQPNKLQTEEYVCNSCGTTKLVNCKTQGCIGKVQTTDKGFLYCSVCEEPYSVNSLTTVTFW